MKAIRITKRRSNRPGAYYFKTHWIRENDTGRTVCGLVIADLDGVEECDLERQPSSEACLACEREREGYTTRSPAVARVTLQPSLGYFSPQHGRGHRILK